MVQSDAFQTMKRFAGAARRLVEGDLANAEEGRFSKTIFMAGVGEDSPVERGGIETAMAQGYALIILEFGTGSRSKGPRCLHIAIRGENGSAQIHRDCALVDVGAERLIIVPRGPGARGHFAIGGNGIEHRAGRPPSLAAGMIRATRRLKALAKELRQTGPTLDVHALGEAA